MQKKKIFITIGAILGGLIATYLGFSIYFMNHFYFRTTINGMNVSGYSVEKVREVSEKGVKDFKLKLLERNEMEEELVGKDFDLEQVWDDSVSNLLKNQNGFLWVVKLFQPDKLNCETLISYDEDKLELCIYTLQCMQAVNQEEPQNATVSDYDKEEGFTLVPAVQGSKVDFNKFKRAVVSSIEALSTELDLEEEKCYVKPEIDDDNEELLASIEQLNNIIQMKITYEMGTSTEVLDKDTFLDWLSVDKNGEITFDDEAIDEFVSDMGSTYNTSYTPKTLATSYGQTVTINGPYGWYIDKEGEREQIKKDILAAEDVTRDFVYLYEAHSRDENDYGNSYVEINLTAQHLFLYIDGELIVESDFVSGDVSKGLITPPGAFRVTYTEKDAILRGENYATHVYYWMPFNGDIGLHDAVWRGGFGGAIYMRNGSHGCVNLPYSTAETLFSYVETGFPVLVYELPGTETEKGIFQMQAYGVIDLINEIGPVDPSRAEAIAVARANYDALSEGAKAYVSNYQVLLDAETVLASMTQTP